MSLFSKLFSKPSKEDVLRFNYHSSFKAIPTLIEKYNECKSLLMKYLILKNIMTAVTCQKSLLSKSRRHRLV